MFNSENPFNLAKLPPSISIQDRENFNEFIGIYHTALKNIAELNGMLREIDNPDILFSPLYLYESIGSSAVENIYTTVESVLEEETRPERERTQENNKEVCRYREALLEGFECMRKFSLSSRTIKAIHKKLGVPKGVSGEFRKVQNQIAHRDSEGQHTVIYTPPSISSLDELLSNWAKFVHKDDKSFFLLIKVAICHYQFEAIHPFEDGNGRTGRILLVLQLVLEKILDIPVLFISSYLNRYNNKYKELLLNISKKGEWWEFIQFMLEGFSLQALETKNFLTHIRKERKKMRNYLYNQNQMNISRGNVSSIVDHVFAHPITHPTFMAKSTQLHWQTCSRYLKFMVKAGFLRVKEAGKYKYYHNKAFAQWLS